MANKVKEAWKAGRAVVNGWLAIPNAFSAEMFSQAGWDSVTVDMQHGVQDYLSCVSCFQGMQPHGVTPMVRVPWNEPGIVGKVLDAGAYGVICPMENTEAEARARAPAVLILDELDAVGNRGDNAGPNQNYRVQVINAFLALMDEIARAPGVIVVATCNHIELIDPAVLRPGRFDLRVEVPLPDAATLAGVLRRHLALPEAEVSVLARHCVGLSLAECDAELRAARGGATSPG